MDTANTSKSRGNVIKVPDATPGIVFANGQQQYFTLERVWKSPVAPAANQTVDVEFDSVGAIAAITVVDSHQGQQFSKESLNQLGNVAQERGKEAAKLAQQGVGALAARMGWVPLGAAVLVWIAWFFFPAASVQVMGQISYTFWNLLGVDFNNPETLAGGGGDHGLFAIIGLLAIAVPFAAPFIRAEWAKYLNAAPLAFVVVGWAVIYMDEHKAMGDIAQMAGANPFSFSWGIFALLIIAAVLGAGALKKPATV